MKWIKASERLPKVINKSYPAKIGEQYGVITLYDAFTEFSGKGFFQSFHDRNNPDFNKLEWLDESDQFTQPAGVGDMTAREFFTADESPFTLDFLSPTEQETFLNAVELYAKGKVNQSRTPPPLSNEASRTPEVKGYSLEQIKQAGIESGVEDKDIETIIDMLPDLPTPSTDEQQ